MMNSPNGPIYTDSTLFPPADGPELTENEARARLEQYMAEESASTSPLPGRRRAIRAGTPTIASTNTMVGIFNREDARTLIPNPTLRAGFAALKGTIGEPAIDFLLTAKTSGGLPLVTIIKMDDSGLIKLPAIAGTLKNTATGQMSILFNPRYKSENPFLFTNTMAHEALHSDNIVTNMEEVICLGIVDVLLHMQQLVNHPGLALDKTELTQRRNANSLARFNSGEGAVLGLYKSNNNAPVYPNSLDSYTSWWDQFKNLPNLTDTPGNVLLGQYLQRMVRNNDPVCSGNTFSKTLLDCIDQVHGPFSADDLVKVANALRLNTGS